MRSARRALMLHLQIATFKAKDLLASVNARRTLLGLPRISELTADAKLDAGLSVATKPFDFNKESALRDLRALADAAKGFAELGKAEAAAITADLARLDEDPALLRARSSAASSSSAGLNSSTARHARCAIARGKAMSSFVTT